MKWHDPFNKCKRVMPNGRKGKKWPLMPRQKQILEYYQEGFTTKRIAEKMGIKVQTLYVHLRQIYYKFDVHNIQDAIKAGLGEQKTTTTKVDASKSSGKNPNKERGMNLREAASGLLTTVESAIKAGDWKVDGACDPTVDIIRLKNILAKPQHQWIGLTDEERADCWSSSAVQSAINVEAKLKEKNND